MKMKRLRLKAVGSPSSCSALLPTASGSKRIVFSRMGRGKQPVCNVIEVPAEWGEKVLESLGWFEEAPAEVVKPPVKTPAPTLEPAPLMKPKAPSVKTAEPKPTLEPTVDAGEELSVEVAPDPKAKADDALAGQKPTVAELVNGYKRDELMKMVKERGVVIHDRATKGDIAEALLAKWSAE